MKRLFIASMICSLLVGCANEQAKQPNIVVVICDDLGYADVGFNGSPDITTPTLDQLAAGGTIFTSGYVAHPFCGPSRAGLMTGRYPHEYGAQFNIPANSGDRPGYGIPVTETFMSKMLQSAGYYTGAIGKWHLGGGAAFHPNQRGFDDFYGFLGGGHEYFPAVYQAKYQKQKEAGRAVIHDYLQPLEHNGEQVKETEYITDALSREAVRFVEDAAQKNQPFFLYLAYNAPHSPLQAKEEDLAMFDHIEDPKRKKYAAMVYAVDRGVSKLVESLKATGEYDNTLIVFLSDNGGKVVLGANNYPLQNGKGSISEGGYRVPMFFHWPDHVPAGQKYAYPVTAIDFYPTFAGLGGAKLPAGKQLDGVNIWEDFLAGKNPRDGQMIFAMRHWPGYSDVGARMNEWKVLKQDNKPWQLYNVDTDMAEQNDLSETYPDKVQDLVLRAKKWSEEHAEPRWFDPESLREDWVEKDMAKFNGVFDIDQ
ncbi:sulfatase-like hydrolase/transferase [Reichenbachiella carrageenanivorans]|uniref:Sulfatase-like hydrolase/transferase n=1 Tax=Reichenbachiella carrageenanivorans TaxID=2979869 RepID=A0ABY6CZQ2_9BACT|nr:sulfatase-like hydrolase/transferase [Reichenbachiella carrageenanivorans]UXX79386.1 sulfatase-like hydrolase/transferase [Reichenbachiella carrageenanivorans]